MTRLVGVAYRFFGIRDLKANSEAWDSGFESKFGIESMRGRWNTKNNPRDYGIVQSCVGIAELKPQSNLSKRDRCCCRALVHFHFSAFSSIFPPNWTTFRHAKSRLKIFARCRPLTALTFFAYAKIGGMFKSNV